MRLVNIPIITTTIISLLTTIGIASISKAKKKAEDVERRQSLKSLQQALELYHSDKGTYYINGSGWMSTGVGYANFSGYGYRGNIVAYLEKNGYLTEGGIPQHRAGATWLIKKGEYRHRIMMHSCASARGENWPAGVERFSKGYTISTKLNYPRDVDISNLETLCGGTSARKKGMNYGLQME